MKLTISILNFSGVVLLSLFSVQCTSVENDTTAQNREPKRTVRLYAVDRYEGIRRLHPESLEVMETIDVGRRPHGLIASPDGRYLYITVETSNELVKLDVASGEILARTRVGPVPNEPTISGDGRYVFVPQRGGEHCDVVDTRTMTVVDSLPAGEEQHNAYTCARGDHVYVTSMKDELITVIDPHALQITSKIPVGGIPRPVALTRDESVAYVALSGLHGFVVLNLNSHEVEDKIEIPVPDGTPRPLLDTYTHGLLLSPDERELWLASYATGKVYAFALPEREVMAEIEVGEGPHWFTLHPAGEPLYVTLERAGKVAAIHRGLRVVQHSASVGQAPTRILAFQGPSNAGGNSEEGVAP